MTPEEMKKFCQENEPEKAAQLLLDWVNDDQPDGFMDHYTSRGMCSFVADQYQGRFGGNWDYIDFYFFMWSGGSDKLPSKEQRARRHERCGMPMDTPTIT